MQPDIASQELDVFRTQVRAWIEENCPPSQLNPFRSQAEWYWGGRTAHFASDDARLWFERMRDKGWIVPDWPVDYGGAGLAAEHADVIRTELRGAGCRRPLISLGTTMLGPVLLRHGTNGQKAEHLRPMARGKIRWCQGYSEPSAGSDLASLQCKAVLDNGQYTVNGQKIWTSGAHQSDWIYCLVRTGRGEKPQDGITFLLIDLKSPGVSVTPIVLISGESEFCITTFDNVTVPEANRIGAEGKGWAIAKELLAYERQMYSLDARSDRTGSGMSLAETAKTMVGSIDEKIADPLLRDEVVQVELDRLAYDATISRVNAAIEAGQAPGPEVSFLKYFLSELNQRRTDLRLRFHGNAGLTWDGDATPEPDWRATREYLRSKADSIAGGTTEVQLNIIAKRVLGLPESQSKKT